MKTKLFIVFSILMIFLAGNILADTSFYVQQNSNYTMKISATLDGFRLGIGGMCNISINYPTNSSYLTKDSVMTNEGDGYFSFNLTSNWTDITGEYCSKVECIESGINDTSNFCYEVNPTGIRPSDQKTEAITRSVYVMFVVSAILFAAFFFFLFAKKSPPVTWTFFILSFIFFLIGINIISISLSDEVVNPRLESFFDSFTAISFIMYWFLAGILILLWLFAFWNTWLYKKNLSNIQRFGG